MRACASIPIVSEPFQFMEQQIKSLLQAGRPTEALASSSKWVKSAPRSDEAWFYKSMCEMQLGDTAEALRSATRALRFAPDSPRIKCHKASLHLANCQTREALDLARSVVASGTKQAASYHAAGQIFLGAKEVDSAVEQFKTAVRLAPNIPVFHSALAIALEFTNRSSEALVAAYRAIELDPGNVKAYWQISQMTNATKDDTVLPLLDRALQNLGNDPQAGSSLNFARAKQFEDLKQYSEIVPALEKGSRALLYMTPYDEASEVQLHQQILEEYTSQLLGSPPQGCNSQEPVFIIGMPRSGTTLVEQIIATYNDFFVAGELPNFTTLLRNHFLTLNPGSEGIAAFRNAKNLNYEKLGTDYIQSTRPRTGRTQYFIDKYPMNFMNVGPAAIALPGARFIHLSRNPMDTSFSNYKLLFSHGTGLYSYDQETLARYYIRYTELMNHWRRTLPGRILDVVYEDLISDPEGQTRRITDYLELQWTPDCLDFYKSNKPVATASTAQVRNPINSSSVGAWKNCRKHLGVLEKTLIAAGIDVE